MLRLNYKKLDVWKLSIKFFSRIYKITSKYPKEKLFGLTSQTRRAATSIRVIIAEGASISLIEQKRIFEISKSS